MLATRIHSRAFAAALAGLVAVHCQSRRADVTTLHAQTAVPVQSGVLTQSVAPTSTEAAATDERPPGRTTSDINASSAPWAEVGGLSASSVGLGEEAVVRASVHASLQPCSLDESMGGAGNCVRVGASRFRIWGAVRSGKMPKALATDHAGQYLYSSNMGSDGEQGLSVFRTDPLRLERHVAVRGNAIELLVTKDDRHLWVSDAAAWGKLRRYDVSSWTLDRDVAVPGFPKWFVADRAEANLYVSLWTWDAVSRVNESGQVATLRTPRGKVSGRHSKNPRGAALSADERELYVLNNHDHTLSVIDVPQWKEKQRVPIGYAPRHIVARPSADTFLVSLTGEDAVVEWNATQREVTRRLRAGKRPKTIATSNDGRFLFAANFVSNSLSVVDLQSGESRELGLGLHKPSGLSVRADDRFVYVSGFCSNDVWAIERIDDGRAGEPNLGQTHEHKPCLTCRSTFAGCPYPPGKEPAAAADEPVKSDAEWGW